jgi:hypothetical protein
LHEEIYFSDISFPRINEHSKLFEISAEIELFSTILAMAKRRGSGGVENLVTLSH